MKSSLLGEVDKEDVIKTKQAGDKGVDVAGNVQLGITSVREVVQVKRIEHEIGVRKQTVELLEVDREFFEPQVEAGVEAEIEI